MAQAEESVVVRGKMRRRRGELSPKSEKDTPKARESTSSKLSNGDGPNKETESSADEMTGPDEMSSDSYSPRESKRTHSGRTSSFSFGDHGEAALQLADGEHSCPAPQVGKASYLPRAASAEEGGGLSPAGNGATALNGKAFEAQDGSGDPYTCSRALVNESSDPVPVPKSEEEAVETLPEGDELVREIDPFVLVMVSSILQSVSGGPKTEAELRATMKVDLERCRTAVPSLNAGSAKLQAELLEVRFVIDVLQAMGLLRNEFVEISVGGGPNELHPTPAADQVPRPCACRHVMAEATRQLRHRFSPKTPEEGDHGAEVGAQRGGEGGAEAVQEGGGGDKQEQWSGNTGVEGDFEQPAPPTTGTSPLPAEMAPAAQAGPTELPLAQAAIKAVGKTEGGGSRGMLSHAPSPTPSVVSNSISAVPNTQQLAQDSVPSPPPCIDSEAAAEAVVAVLDAIADRTGPFRNMPAEKCAAVHASFLAVAPGNSQTCDQLKPGSCDLPRAGLRLAEEGMLDHVRSVWGSGAMAGALEHVRTTSGDAPLDAAAFTLALDGQVHEGRDFERRYGKAALETALIWMHQKSSEWEALHSDLSGASPLLSQQVGRYEDGVLETKYEPCPSEDPLITGSGMAGKRVVRFRLDPNQDKVLMEWQGPSKLLTRLDKEAAQLGLQEELLLRQLMTRVGMSLPAGYSRKHCISALRSPHPHAYSEAKRAVPALKRARTMSLSLAGAPSRSSRDSASEKKYGRRDEGGSSQRSVEGGSGSVTAAELVRRARRNAAVARHSQRDAWGDEIWRSSPASGASSSLRPATPMGFGGLKRKLSQSLTSGAIPSKHEVPPIGRGSLRDNFTSRKRGSASSTPRSVSSLGSNSMGTPRGSVAPSPRDWSGGGGLGDSVSWLPAPSPLKREPRWISGIEDCALKTKQVEWAWVSSNFTAIQDLEKRPSVNMGDIREAQSMGGIDGFSAAKCDERKDVIVAPQFRLLREDELAGNLEASSCCDGEEDTDDEAYDRRHAESLRAMKEKIDAVKLERELKVAKKRAAMPLLNGCGLPGGASKSPKGPRSSSGRKSPRSKASPPAAASTPVAANRRRPQVSPSVPVS
jgi:hypothetical protein